MEFAGIDDDTGAGVAFNVEPGGAFLVDAFVDTASGAVPLPLIGSKGGPPASMSVPLPTTPGCILAFSGRKCIPAVMAPASLFPLIMF